MTQKPIDTVDYHVNRIKKTSRNEVAMERIGAAAAHKELLGLALEQYDKERDDEIASARHAEQMKELRDTRTSQEDGNTIQRWVRAALFIFPIATIITMIVIEWWGKSP